MYKLTTFTYSLLVVFLSCVLWGCKDEPDFNFDVNMVEGNHNMTMVYGYTDVDLTFVCSAQYLDIVQPKFCILSTDGTSEIITPSREDFKLSEKKTTVSLKGTIEDSDESVNREMESYEYTLNLRTAETEVVLMVFAFASAKDVDLEYLFGMMDIPGASIFRGFRDVDVTAYCTDGQLSVNTGSKNLNNVSGYLIENSLSNFIDAILMLSDYVPTFVSESVPSDNKNKFPPFDIETTCADIPVSLLEDLTKPDQDRQESKASFDSLIESGIINSDLIPLIKQYARK